MRSVLFIPLGALVVSLSACGPSLQALSSGHVGCSPSDVEISEVDKQYSSVTWTATCHDEIFYCTKWLSGQTNSPATYVPTGSGQGVVLPGVHGYDTQTSCTRAARSGSDNPTGSDATRSVTATSPPNEPSGSAPAGAAGFTFDSDEPATAKICTGAGFTWTPPAQEGRAACSGTPVDVGLGAPVDLSFCAGKLCEIAIKSQFSPDKLPPDWVSQYRTSHSLLREKYGIPSKQEDAIPKSCEGEIRRCVGGGALQLTSDWQWGSGRSIRLTLGRIQDAVSLVLVYRDSSIGRPKPAGL